jgi:Tfp pilus assembly ATPase PilU
MQTFDGELEKLINAGIIDKETGLSYATNRTNLQLVLETGGNQMSDDVTPSGKFPPLRPHHRRGRPGRRRPRWTT